MELLGPLLVQAVTFATKKVFPKESNCTNFTLATDSFLFGFGVKGFRCFIYMQAMPGVELK